MQKSLVICQTGGGGGGHPEPNSIFEKSVFQGPHRTILGQPKHVLQLVPSPNALWAKLLRKWEIGKFNKITS